jgi:hypothetical protein
MVVIALFRSFIVWFSPLFSWRDSIGARCLHGWPLKWK